MQQSSKKSLFPLLYKWEKLAGLTLAYLSASEAPTPHHRVRGLKALGGVRLGPPVSDSASWSPCLDLYRVVFQSTSCYRKCKLQYEYWYQNSIQRWNFCDWRLQRGQGADSCVTWCENVCPTRVYLGLPAPKVLPHSFQYTRKCFARNSNLHWLSYESAPFNHTRLWINKPDLSLKDQIFKKGCEGIPGSPLVWIWPFHSCGLGRVQSLVGELRSCKLHGVAKKRKKGCEMGPFESIILILYWRKKYNFLGVLQ